MRIKSNLAAILCLFSFFLLVPCGRAGAYEVTEGTGQFGQAERYWKGVGGLSAEVHSKENMMKTEKATDQPDDYQTGGEYDQGGATYSGGIASMDHAPLGQSRTLPDTETNFSEPEWTVEKDGPTSHPGPPRGDQHFRHNQQIQFKAKYPDPFTAAYADKFREQNNMPGGVVPAEAMTTGLSMAGTMMGDQANSPDKAFGQGQACGQGACQGGGDALADAFDPTWLCMMDLNNQSLINVANEASGSAASSLQPTKTHQNAVWFVQRMYKEVYLPMAILLLLPGAVITHTKGFVAHGVVFNSNDDDGVSPFTGILRSIIAIFLIPATQLILSWCIDVGNSMHYEVNRYVEPGIIFLWADEQVFRPPLENMKNQLMGPKAFKVLGKMSQGPEEASGVEDQSKATIMLQAMANLMAQSAAFGLVMLCAFQITMVCYLMLMGPVAAAFYAWPGSVGSLFSRIFPVWVDAVINLSLWKFWWSVVLLCMCTRLTWLGAEGGFSMYSEWELLMFIAFLTILTYVPFNPFDFKAGDMVSQIMQKAEQAVGEASQKGGK